MKRRASAIPSRYTMMLWVARSLARKSSTCGMSTEVCGPSDTTLEKPTPFWRAQSSIDAVSAPDCDTSASGPVLASGPATLAFRCSGGRWKPSVLGPSRCTPSRRAILRHCAAWSASMPLEMTAAAVHPMRPAISRAAATSRGARAIRARSAWVWASSSSVPLVRTSRKRSVPSKRSARKASRSVRPAGVWPPGSSAWPTKATMEAGAKSGFRKCLSMPSSLHRSGADGREAARNSRGFSIGLTCCTARIDAVKALDVLCSGSGR